MMGYIALPAILQQVMQDSAYSSGRFGEIRELVLGMLDTYNYEKVSFRFDRKQKMNELRV